MPGALSVCDFYKKSEVEEALDLSENVVGGVAEFLVENLVGSRSTEALQTIDVPCTGILHERIEGSGETCGKAEACATYGKHRVAILGILTEEETDGGEGSYLSGYAKLLKLLSHMNEECHLTAVGNEGDGGILGGNHDVATLLSLVSLSTTVAGYGGQILEILTGEDEH